MKKSWKTGGRTYDTDRYVALYHLIENKISKTVWQESPFVGPGSYNRSYISLITGNRINNAGYITASRNPFFENRSTLKPENAKFKP
jgi:hypothetical protein